MDFFNASDIVGLVLVRATETTTGDMFITLFLVLLFAIAICLMFNIQLEWIGILILPLCLGYASYYTEFVGTLSVILIYLAILVTKNFILK